MVVVGSPAVAVGSPVVVVDSLVVAVDSLVVVEGSPGAVAGSRVAVGKADHTVVEQVVEGMAAGGKPAVGSLLVGEVADHRAADHTQEEGGGGHRSADCGQEALQELYTEVGLHKRGPLLLLLIKA